MAWLFLIVVCGIAIYCNWNWCWQWVKPVWSFCKSLRVKIQRKPATVLLYVAGFFILAALWFFGSDVYELYTVLSYQIKYDSNTSDDYLSIAYRYFGILAAAGTIVGYFIAIVRNMIADNKNAIAEERNKISEQGRITESMVQAIAQIGAVSGEKPNIEVRLGGLYSLQRIMQDSPRDELTIAKIFYAYVREYLKKDKTKRLKKKNQVGKECYQVPEDIQATLNIISQFIKEKTEKDELFFPEDQLNFSHVDFSKHSLVRVDFSHNNLDNIDFSEADLSYAILSHSIVSNANLSGAYLMGTNLSKSFLLQADLSGANLFFANLSGAHLFLANLSGVHLFEVNLSETSLHRTNLSGADLSDALNLTQDQVNEAFGDKDTKLPQGLICPDSWKKQKKIKNLLTTPHPLAK